MSVKANSLENPERDLQMTTREATEPSEAGKLAALRQRIAEAKVATPDAPIPECRDCYRRGWMAALRALE